MRYLPGTRGLVQRPPPTQGRPIRGHEQQAERQVGAEDESLRELFHVVPKLQTRGTRAPHGGVVLRAPRVSGLGLFVQMHRPRSDLYGGLQSQGMEDFFQE